MAVEMNLQDIELNNSLPKSEMAVVGFYNDYSALLLWVTPGGGLEFDIHEGGLGAEQVSEWVLDKSAPDHGIWVWEGHVRFWTNHEGEGESEYHTHCWRKPTPEEWVAIMAQRNPFDNGQKRWGEIPLEGEV